METISLIDFLTAHQAPRFIDFLSIDTEGSELAILEAFDFEAYQFGSICVEHNYNTKTRNAIYNLLSNMGHQRKHPNASAWDDWYVPRNG